MTVIPTDRPLILTDRLELWVPRARDIDEMIAIVSHEETGRYLGQASIADHYTRFQRNAGSWLLHGYGGFMVRERGKDALIGNCGIFHSYRGLGEDFDDMPEAGWIIAADQVGRGYAYEAMRGAIDWFEQTHGFRRMVCMIEPGNAPSIALAGKLEFDPLRQASLPDGAPVALFTRGK